jgi:hypothetical protein
MKGDIVQEAERIAFAVYVDQTDASLVTMVRRMREQGWTTDQIKEFFVRNPVENAPIVMERAGVQL